MEPRVAILIERFDASLGGAERSIYELASALAQGGCEAHVVAAKGRALSNVHILCADSPGTRVGFTAFASAVREHLAHNHYDIIHSVLPFDFADVYQPRGGAYAESSARNCASVDCPVTRAFKRITAFANLRRSRLLLAEKRIARKSKGPLFLALSQYVAESFRSCYDTDPGRIRVIHGGVRVNPRVDEAEADKLRSNVMAAFGLKEADNPVFFLFAANNFRLKGLACLIRAMKLAASDRTNPARLVVVGRDKPRVFRRLAAQLGVASRLVFLGAIPHIHNLLAVTDVAVLPTFYDPCSRFTLEALAAGKPVITTRYNGAADLFTADRHGKLVDDPRNITALAEAIHFFCIHENTRAAREAIGQDKLAERISVHRVAGELKSVYDEIISRRNGRPQYEPSGGLRKE